MTCGRLIAVVGPSGVGKDSVMAGLHAAQPDIHLVQRHITRPTRAGDEPFHPVTDSAFSQALARGDYALHWWAHGLCYGIPVAEVAGVRSGATALVNLSRTVLMDAAQLGVPLTVLSLTARPEVLAQRLAQRGRDAARDRVERLARADLALPPVLTCPLYRVDNSGPLSQTISTCLTLLKECAP